MKERREGGVRGEGGRRRTEENGVKGKEGEGGDGGEGRGSREKEGRKKGERREKEGRKKGDAEFCRCHRIGQTENVKVYRFLTENTQEADIFGRISMKLGLTQALMSNQSGNTLGFLNLENGGVFFLNFF
jgi:hypothetical protein